MGFDDEETDEIDIESIEAQDTFLPGLATSYYDYNGPQQPRKPEPVSETLREERRKLGQCIKCGTLLPMSIHGLQPCQKGC